MNAITLKKVQKPSLFLKKLGKLPTKPGVYIYKDSQGEILYVGKGKNLKARVKSYFSTRRGERPFTPTGELHPAKDLTGPKKMMVANIADLDYTVTDTETEALLLEAMLIKKHRPPFNVVMKDDKSYQYIKIDFDSEWPAIYGVRRPNMRKGASKYFGPFTSGRSVKETIKLIKYIFPYCSKPPEKNRRPRACFQYQIGRCPGVCMGKVSKKEYIEMLGGVTTFLKGKYEDVVRDLEQRMKKASESENYEFAAKLRDQIEAVQTIMEKQKVISTGGENQDFVSLVEGDKHAAINLFVVRSGRLIDKRNYLLDNTSGSTKAELLKAFFEQYYPQTPDIPREIIVGAGFTPASTEALEGLGVKKITTVERGTKKKMITLGESNAKEFLLQRAASFQREEVQAKIALKDLAKALGFKKIPKRVEIYDMSNIQRAHAVGVMVVFTDGLPNKKEYRKFTIKDAGSIDDTHMMAEVLRRRLSRSVGVDHDRPEWPSPDLIILDGGKGQLSVVGEVIDRLAPDVPYISLAKREEEVFFPGVGEPVLLPRKSDSLHLIQRMRDETHRFAISFYRSKHGKSSTKSVLDNVPGIGPATKKKLIKTFGSVAGIKQADREQIEQVIGPKLTDALFEHI